MPVTLARLFGHWTLPVRPLIGKYTRSHTHYVKPLDAWTFLSSSMCVWCGSTKPMPASRLCGACFCGAMIACVRKSVGCFCYRNEQGWKSWNKHEWKLNSSAVGASSKALCSVWQPGMLQCCHPVKLQFECMHLCHFCCNYRLEMVWICVLDFSGC